MKPIKMLALGACVGAVIAGCGGGGSDSTSAPPATPATASGTFIDSAVEGLHYTSGGQSGSTGADGSFTCEVGQPVTFTLGNLVLPTVTCATGTNVVSPMTLFETPDLTDARVVNLAQLLQTLDSNGDPADGITIDDAVYTATTDMDISTVDFAATDFDTNAALTAFITQAKSGVATPLVSESSATAHMQSQILAGTWILDESDLSTNDSRSVFTFFPDGSFMLAVGRTYDGGVSGMERGNYTWNATTGAFTVASVSADTLTDGGLSHDNVGITIQIAANTMTFHDPLDGDILLTRLVPDTNPIVGSWYTASDEIGGNHVNFTFFADGSFTEAQDGATVGDGHSGMERGTYTWDQATGAITWSVSVNTDGDWGTSGIGTDPFTAQVVGNTLSLINQSTGDTNTFARVVP